MGSSPEAIVDKRTILTHGEWKIWENGDKVTIGVEPALRWTVDVRVQGERDSECALLKFGFVQCITRINVWVKRGKDCKQNQPPAMPWWDVARGQPDDAFWYASNEVQNVDACFNLSPRNQEDKVARVKFEHIDFPHIFELPWQDPPGDKKSILTELVYDADFVTTLVEKSPSKAPRALLYLPWSVDARVEFPRKGAEFAQFRRKFVHVRPEAVTMGGAPGVALVNKNKGHFKWVPCR